MKAMVTGRLLIFLSASPSPRHWEHFGYMGIVSSMRSSENDANIRTNSRSAAPREWHMGKCRRRPTLPKQRRVGVAHQPMTFLVGHACLTSVPPPRWRRFLRHSTGAIEFGRMPRLPEQQGSARRERLGGFYRANSEFNGDGAAVLYLSGRSGPTIYRIRA